MGYQPTPDIKGAQERRSPEQTDPWDIMGRTGLSTERRAASWLFAFSPFLLPVGIFFSPTDTKKYCRSWMVFFQVCLNCSLMKIPVFSVVFSDGEQDSILQAMVA